MLREATRTNGAGSNSEMEESQGFMLRDIALYIAL